ncbi:MAG: flagellar assembly protein FliW [Geminicoccaceae bacterium]
MLSAATTPDPMAIPRPEVSVPVIDFPHGLPGFPEARSFQLEPVPATLPLLRLRAMDLPALTFLLVGSPEGGPTLATIESVCAGLGLSPPDTVVLFVATRIAGDLLVNLRAPILIDPAGRRGRQVVLPDPKLPLRAPYRFVT